MPKTQCKMRKAEHRCKGADDVISAYPISLEMAKALALEMHKPHKLRVGGGSGSSSRSSSNNKWCNNPHK